MKDDIDVGDGSPSRRSVMKVFGAGATGMVLGGLGSSLFPGAARAAVPSLGTPMHLVNVRSGCLLDVFGGQTSAGAGIIQWSPTGGANQTWSTADAGGGWVTIGSANSGNVLDVSGGQTNDGAQVIQWTPNGGANQQWQLVDAGGGRVKILGRGSGKLLGVVGDSVATGTGTEIRADSNDPSQWWTPIPTSGYWLDATVTEPRSDLVLAGAGGTGGGIAYGVTRNGWSRNGQAWYPISGEFHYVRYPAQRWERELGKLKAAGVGIVATYVFWNHHEQPQGTWDWTGRRDLRSFIAAAQRQGLLVWLRVGPYINAEAVNGGLPAWALTNARTDDPGYLSLVGLYLDQVAAQVHGQFVMDGGPVVGIQLENEFQGDAAHISTLRQMVTARGMVAPYYTVTANSHFTTGTAIPLQGAYCYRGWEYDGGTGAVSGFIYGTDEWTANTDIGGATYDTLTYPRGFCEMGTGSPMGGTSRFQVDSQTVVAAAYDSVGRGTNYLGYYMFHGGTQVAGMASSNWPLTYDFQAPLGEFGQTRDSYRRYRRLHTFATTFAADLVPTRVSRDPGQIMDPAQTGRLRYIGRFDSSGRGFVFVDNIQRNVTMPTRTDMQLNILQGATTLTLASKPVTMPPGRSNIFPVRTDLNGVELRWATVEPLAKLAGDDLPTWVFWAPDWTPRDLAFAKGVVLTGEIGSFTKSIVGTELIANVPAQQRTSILVTAAGSHTPSARIIVLGDTESLGAVVAPLNGRDRLIVTGAAELTGCSPSVRFAAQAGTTISVDVFPVSGLAPATGWAKTSTSAPFARYSKTLAAAPPAPQITAIGPGQWQISADTAAVAGLAEARLVLDYRGGDATLIGAGTPMTNDLYHGEKWTIDLKNLDAAALAGLVLQVSPWDPSITGVTPPTGATPSLAGWTWVPIGEVAWS